MKASSLMRVALEAEEVKEKPEEQATPTPEEKPAETPKEPEATTSETTDVKPADNAVPSDADRQAKLDATEANAHPNAQKTDDAPAAGEPDGGDTTVVDAATEPEQKKLKKEKEFVFYGKVADFKELKACKNVEYQEQYEVKIQQSDKNATGGRIRVRKTVKGEKEPKFVLTTKTKLPDGSDYESDCKTTEENFIQFKYFCEGGMIKDRYSFPVEGHKGLRWEVDGFTGTNGLFHECVKIDLEVEDEGIEMANMPPFPIQLTDVITNQNGQRTPEEEAIVRTLYDTVFRTPNPIISKK